jgi:ATP-dependent DNA ligase
VCAQLRAFLPPGCVVDGELVAWESGRGRTSFPLLQRRVTAGRRLPQEMREHPAHLVLFDLLQDAGGVELLRLPLVARRARLTELLTGGPPQLPLCPQTLDWSQAMTWFTEGSAAGLEGLVIKDVAGRYRPGRADWLKIKTRASTEAVIGGATGSLTDPRILLLGRYGTAGRLRYVGRTNPLSVPQRRELGSILPVAAWAGPYETHPWPQPLPAIWSGQFQQPQPIAYVPLEPVIVVEVSADVAVERGRWRHPVTMIRTRLDLDPSDVDAPPGRFA